MSDVVARLNSAVAPRALLSHPFYEAWTAGKLRPASLRFYAAQYYPFVSAFPTFVSGVHSGCDDAKTRRELLENLLEEERGDENHPELWLRFAEAIGVSRDEARATTPLPETRALVDTFRRLTRAGSTAEGLAALYAYESQVPAVAEAKIDGLRRFYGIEAPAATAFFQVHRTLDLYHSATCANALDRHVRSAADADSAVASGGAAAGALWSFLDGVRREAC